MNRNAYSLLMVATIVATVGTILTLIPWPSASYENVLGYRSLCTFSPAATLYCAAIAGTCCVLRASLVKRKAMAGKAVFKTAGIAVVAVLYLAGLATTIWFVNVKSQYTDGTTAPTVSVPPHD